MSNGNYDSGELARTMIEERITRAAEERLANTTVRVPEPRRRALARRVRRIADIIDN